MSFAIEYKESNGYINQLLDYDSKKEAVRIAKNFILPKENILECRVLENIWVEVWNSNK